MMSGVFCFFFFFVFFFLWNVELRVESGDSLILHINCNFSFSPFSIISKFTSTNKCCLIEVSLLLFTLEWMLFSPSYGLFRSCHCMPITPFINALWFRQSFTHLKAWVQVATTRPCSRKCQGQIRRSRRDGNQPLCHGILWRPPP